VGEHSGEVEERQGVDVRRMVDLQKAKELALGRLHRGEGGSGWEGGRVGGQLMGEEVEGVRWWRAVVNQGWWRHQVDPQGQGEVLDHGEEVRGGRD